MTSKSFKLMESYAFVFQLVCWEPCISNAQQNYAMVPIRSQVSQSIKKNPIKIILTINDNNIIYYFRKKNHIKKKKKIYKFLLLCTTGNNRCVSRDHHESSNAPSRSEEVSRDLEKFYEPWTMVYNPKSYLLDWPNFLSQYLGGRKQFFSFSSLSSRPFYYNVCVEFGNSFSLYIERD